MLNAICGGTELSRTVPNLRPHVNPIAFNPDHYLGVSTMSSPLTPAAVSEQIAPTVGATSILHRTPWRPPVAVSGEGIYITLEDGRKIIDGVGGAAVNCLGNGHPEPVKAIKEQVDKLSCELMPSIHGNQKCLMSIR